MSIQCFQIFPFSARISHFAACFVNEARILADGMNMVLTVAAGRRDIVTRDTDDFALVSRIGSLSHSDFSCEKNNI